MLLFFFSIKFWTLDNVRQSAFVSVTIVVMIM